MGVFQTEMFLSTNGTTARTKARVEINKILLTVS